MDINMQWPVDPSKATLIFESIKLDFNHSKTARAREIHRKQKKI